MIRSAQSISFLPEEWAALRLFAMRLGNDGNHRQPAPLRAHGRFYDYRPYSAGRNYDECVVRAEMKSVQNLLGITFVILEKQRRAQSVRAHNRGVIGKRHFHQGHESHETTLPRGHLLRTSSGSGRCRKETPDRHAQFDRHKARLLSESRPTEWPSVPATLQSRVRRRSGSRPGIAGGGSAYPQVPFTPFTEGPTLVRSSPPGWLTRMA